MSVARWLFMAGLVLVAGLGMLAVMALVIAWAVNDMLENGVTWLPVFAVLACLGFVFSNSSDSGGVAVDPWHAVADVEHEMRARPRREIGGEALDADASLNDRGVSFMPVAVNYESRSGRVDDIGDEIAWPIGPSLVGRRHRIRGPELQRVGHRERSVVGE